ncbi:zinc ribbon domain-containing protein [Haoranjiania flava]|uniref:C4-type zinc ribbon domain-containing protein n=1 Tax=Haoranjiania flava TaxID=1856322 RepID=A0AAE3LJ85_9BACT|nr:C4-type zinc ribbon domain-containing protein [Haoranjiania flava]MCU7693358.1 C4-type zinc ribbon domain-containing protein [Haoranjiania flava]
MATVKDFSVSEKLSALVKLQKLSSKLDQIQILKGELPIEVSDLEDELIGLNNRKTRIEEEINGMTDFIEQKKAIITQSAELVKKYEAQSENVKNNREFEAINSEIEMQQLEGKLAEKHIRDANNELADKVRSLEELKKKIAGKEVVHNEKKSELDKIIAETDKEEKALTESIEAQRKSMDERLLYSFDRIRNNYRNGLSVVPVERDACGGCFNAIPPQKQSEIRQRKKVMVCENCGRILIDDELNESVEI